MSDDAKKCITVQEAAEISGLPPEFIRQAIKNRSLPGYYTENGNRSTFWIPKAAFMESLEHFYINPSVELINALIAKYQASNKRKVPAGTET